MEQNLVKTSAKQRIIITVITVIMLFSIIASYTAILLSKPQESGLSGAKKAQYEREYNEKQAEFTTASAGYFNDFINFKSEITAYNENAANESGIDTKDLKIGDGRILTDGDTDYMAYYVGWCADESIFDSTFDSTDNPTGFNNILSSTSSLIEGWNAGVVGMQLGGIRVITIPGELAYADSKEICGGYNKPLKFMIMPIAKEGEMLTLADDLDLARTKYQYAVKFNVDYDELFGTRSEPEENTEPSEPVEEGEE